MYLNIQFINNKYTTGLTATGQALGRESRYAKRVRARRTACARLRGAREWARHARAGAARARTPSQIGAPSLRVCSGSKCLCLLRADLLDLAVESSDPLVPRVHRELGDGAFQEKLRTARARACARSTDFRARWRRAQTSGRRHSSVKASAVAACAERSVVGRSLRAPSQVRAICRPERARWTHRPDFSES